MCVSSPLLQFSTTLPFPYVVVPLLLLLSLWTIYQLFLSPLSGIPGPFTARLSRLWITQQAWNGKTHRTMIDLHSKYGPLVRTAPNEVSISSLSAIKKYMEQIHSEQRRMVSSAYSMASLKDLERYVNQSIEVFLARMGSMVGETVDMGKWLQLFAFDVIGEITFSRRFGFMEAGKDDGSFAQIVGAIKSAAWLCQLPWLYWFHEYLSPVLGSHLGINARHGSLRTFAAREITARKDRGTDRKDILSKLFAIHDAKPEFDDNGIISMATGNIFAGSDTTAISARAVIYYLLKNSKCLQKLKDEIDQYYHNGKLNDPVKLTEADQMPYLQAVMYEALRLHPAVGMSLPRVVPEGGFEIEGVLLPAKTVVGVNPWVVHRDPNVFGEDVEAFRPERWVEGDVGDMHRFFFAFGGGSRTCLGRNISWMEMSKLIPTLLLHIDLDLANSSAEWTEACW
ncbi:cytochrome P450 [Tothia fuscella]|uniref:Cytochrome P450 n=1 Tax=Tothia fuscella TaxID=1048955 RepID=A0A9P4NTM8_9PEZI|nr:cytochrome P450 [Tothia fuscella]